MGKEQLSEEAKKMCRMCNIRDRHDNTCGYFYSEEEAIRTQNTRAERGVCKHVEISGPLKNELAFSNPQFVKLSGWIIKEGDQWVYRGKAPRIDDIYDDDPTESKSAR
ncbi:hypothetical protein A2630_01605 [Candidatus Woesebacteria bacterium RIFCSPHIGHO2_01_FULL_44_10]|uniref:Uncharacterized protein n=1 Tax=Candidatus Woesebacteria bacterium RIFCSPLOWO2_01_FULL_44_14 TaxID=1802525 RepID=A0A1F8C1X2_9BACT|nr:MAG: hypothetical protein A2630_01605 [Candidatus Woesebacteria bacterium RIFCSPHIGHO2_01_FULL_44_10]OGM54949.1 MAG: hypothetical protein A3F62_00905 [Candidatus Woesebacteria bacterium RIFCSPHIGHO2_12_FULL_44_11]OGM70336.1 MAG: hypothetical protein A2975_04690 [Candidatus Woesebacteria bacterium RIFCSPLOWO2_01_FULL_44_14]